MLDTRLKGCTAAVLGTSDCGSEFPLVLLCAIPWLLHNCFVYSQSHVITVQTVLFPDQRLFILNLSMITWMSFNTCGTQHLFLCYLFKYSWRCLVAHLSYPVTWTQGVLVEMSFFDSQSYGIVLDTNAVWKVIHQSIAFFSNGLYLLIRLFCLSTVACLLSVKFKTMKVALCLCTWIILSQLHFHHSIPPLLNNGPYKTIGEPVGYLKT